MFFYISFLRPPPTTVRYGDPISFTPQIANDLRTELCLDSFDIYYSWISTQCHSAPRKLTTWKPSAAYKVLDVPSPKFQSLDPKEWRLILLAQHPGGTSPSLVHFGLIDLQSNADGLPLPVSSPPIHFLHKPYQGPPKKQDEIDRFFMLDTQDLDPSQNIPPHNSMIVRENTAFDLDKKVWDSGVGICVYLSRLLLSIGTEQSESIQAKLKRIFDIENVTIIELGSGTGLASIALAYLLQYQSKANFSIWATDLPSAIPLIERNANNNSHLFSNGNIHPAVLDWDQAFLPSAVEAVSFDLILMADVTYNTDAFPSLVSTILKLSSRMKRTRILMAYKERDIGERMLWDMLNSHGVKLMQVGSVEGHGGAPVEIWFAEASECANFELG